MRATRWLVGGIIGVLTSGILICADVVGHSTYDKVEACTSRTTAGITESLLPVAFGLTVAFHSICLLGCLAIAGAAIVDVNIQMRRVVAGHVGADETLDNVTAMLSVPVGVAGMCACCMRFVLIMLVLAVEDLRKCLRSPSMRWYLISQTPGILMVAAFAVGMAAGLVCLVLYPLYVAARASVDNFRLAGRYRQLTTGITELAALKSPPQEKERS